MSPFPRKVQVWRSLLFVPVVTRDWGTRSTQYKHTCSTVQSIKWHILPSIYPQIKDLGLGLSPRGGLRGTEDVYPSKLAGCHTNNNSQHSHARKWDLVKLVNFSPAEPWKDLRYEESGMYFLEGEVSCLSLRECASADSKAMLML